MSAALQVDSLPLSHQGRAKEYWSRLPVPTPGDLPGSGIEQVSLVSPALAGRFFTTVPPGKPLITFKCYLLSIIDAKLILIILPIFLLFHHLIFIIYMSTGLPWWYWTSLVAQTVKRLSTMREWRRQWQPTPVLSPGKSHGRKSLVGCRPWGH